MMETNDVNGTAVKPGQKADGFSYKDAISLVAEMLDVHEEEKGVQIANCFKSFEAAFSGYPVEIREETLQLILRMRAMVEADCAQPLKPVSGPVALFATGLCMVFHDGEQVGELQTTWAHLWAEHAKAKGYDPKGVIFDGVDGSRWQIMPHEDGSWNMQKVPSGSEHGGGLN